jgi:hypothetical protein
MLAVVKVKRHLLICHRKWNGDIVAACRLEAPKPDAYFLTLCEDERALPAALLIQKYARGWLRRLREHFAKPDAHFLLLCEDERALPAALLIQKHVREWLPFCNFETSMVTGASVSVLPKGRSRKTNAIIFGELPFKHGGCIVPFSVHLQQSSLAECVAFYNEAYRDGKDAINFETAFRTHKDTKSKAHFFGDHGELRERPDELIKKRFKDVATEATEKADIFRIVRFAHYGQKEIPTTFAAFLRRFPQRSMGMDAKVYKKWKGSVGTVFVQSRLEKTSKAIVVLQEKQKVCSKRLQAVGRKSKDALTISPRQTLMTNALESYGSVTSEIRRLKAVQKPLVLPLYRRVLQQSLKLPPSAFSNRLDKRVFLDSLKFYCTCPCYWTVARDFPAIVMDYVLKPCYRSRDCNCKDMLAFHAANLRLGVPDIILHPQSPFLRKKGQTIFANNIKACIAKWKLFARVPKFGTKFTPLIIERMELFRRLTDERSRRATTTYDIKPAEKDDFQRIVGVELFGTLLDTFFDELAEKPSLRPLEYARSVLENHCIVALAPTEFMLSHDFMQELELMTVLRRLKFYDNALPLKRDRVVFPNDSLKAFYEASKLPSEPAKVVCIAFARRWRVRDLLKRVKELEREAEVVLHVDSSAPFMFLSKDDLQDWHSTIAYQVSNPKAPFFRQDGLPFFLPSTEQTDTDIEMVSGATGLKALMDKAVAGECYVLCSIEKKRKSLMETAEAFRSDPARLVLKRTFPSGQSSVYHLGAAKKMHLYGEPESTLSLPANVLPFGPRPEVYLVGDMWTPKSKAAAMKLATEKVYAVHLAEGVSEKLRLWQYNDRKVSFTNRPVRDSIYSRGGFEKLNMFLAKCAQEEDFHRKKEEETNERVDWVNHLKRKSMGLQTHRDEKRRALE